MKPHLDRDDAGNLIVPKWALGSLLSLVGVGAGGTYVGTIQTIEKVERRIEERIVRAEREWGARMERHEENPIHPGVATVGQSEEIRAVLVQIQQDARQVRDEQMNRTDRITRLETKVDLLLERAPK